MKMEYTACCLLILQCFIMMEISAEPSLDISPSQITLGMTSALDVNCTFSLENHPGMVAFISLIVSRANTSRPKETFQELAAITEFSPNTVSLLTQEKVSATGVHSQTGESFLHLRWEYPTSVQGGVYQCSAHGLDVIGHNVEITNVSTVKVGQPNLKDIFEKLKEIVIHESCMETTIASMGNQIQTLENDKITMETTMTSMGNQIQTLENDKITMETTMTSMGNQIQTLENDKITMETTMSSMGNQIQTLENNKITMDQYIHNLEKNISDLKTNVAMLQPITVLKPLGKFQDDFYYVSRYGFSNVHKSADVCKAQGGILAEINNANEYKAIQEFLYASSGFTHVVIGGTDEASEGRWVLPSNKSPLPFTAWRSGRPVNGDNWNCLMLTGSTWYMIDDGCYFDPPADHVKFMCEMPRS